MDKRVRTVISTLQRDLSRPVNWRRLSATVGLSPSGLRVLFKQSTGLPPTAYLNRLRFERARQLLCRPESVLRVKEVMAAVGINDPSHFVREFKKRYGETPKMYQRRVGSGSAGVSANEMANWPTKSAPPSLKSVV